MKLYPSGGITTLKKEKKEKKKENTILNNVTRTWKIQLNSTCSKGYL